MVCAACDEDETAARINELASAANALRKGDGCVSKEVFIFSQVLDQRGRAAMRTKIFSSPPMGVVLRIVKLYLSATYTFPLLSTAMPRGMSNGAAFPLPSTFPSPPGLTAKLLQQYTWDPPDDVRLNRPPTTNITAKNFAASERTFRIPPVKLRPADTFGRLSSNHISSNYSVLGRS